jgi:hypothetical protein
MNADPHELALLLLALGRAGVELATHPAHTGQRLRHRPADLPTDLSERLRLHRGAILGLLVDGYAPDTRAGDGDAEHVYDERMGVAVGLGMATHPGSPAWLVAVGESMGNSCEHASHPIYFGHGETDRCDPIGDQRERSNGIRDC